MKIAIISSCSLPVPAVNGGAVESLIESIVKQNELQEKHNIHVYTIYNKQAAESSKLYPNTQFIYLKKPYIIKKSDEIITAILRKVKRRKDIASRNYIWKLNVLSELKKRLKKETYDVIVLQNTIFLFNLFKDNDLYKKYEGKVYFHIHNSLVKTTKIKHDQLLQGVISISDFLYDNIRKYMGENINIVTVYNGIRCDKFDRQLSEKEKTALKQKYGIPRDNNVIIFVGRIAPEKGIREAVLAFNQLNRQDCDFLIVGASYFGSGAVSLFERDVMDSISKNPRIHLSGFVDKYDIWKYYALGDLAVLPSMWEEPLGLTMIEAQAAGIPLITTLSGGIPETVDDKYSILLERDSHIVDKMEKAMETVLSDLNVWKDKARIAQTEVKHRYDEAVFYRNFMDALKVKKAGQS